MTVTLSLPWPNISTNHLYRRGASGHLYLHPQAQVWKDAVIVQARQSGQAMPAGPVALYAWMIPPDRRRRDLDNLLKLTQDALFAAFERDDADIAEIHVYRCRSEPEQSQITVMLIPSAPPLTVDEMRGGVIRASAGELR